MMDLETTRLWIEERRDLALELLRIYLGIALFAKGISFIGQMAALEEVASFTPGWSASAIAHYVVVAHIGGGVLLAIGMITRLAAAVQLPALAGAVLFVHSREGVFAPSMGLELTLLVLFLLCLFTAVGGGRLSADRWLAGHAVPVAH